MTDDLEQLVRDGLRRRADGVDTTAPVVARARRTVRRRRGARAVLAAAVAVVAIGGGLAVLDRADTVDPAPVPGPTHVVDPTGPAEPERWRTEQWHDLVVDVPADWAYGSAPTQMGGMSTVCDDVPFDVPYVGRPIMTSDRCEQIGLLEPVAPYVWLGAAIEPGTVRAGALVQETVEVAGTTLTVAGDDLLRERVLASARTGGACPAELRGDLSSPLPLATTDGLLVCAYRSEDDVRRLAGSERRTPEEAARLEAALAAAPTRSTRCPHFAERLLLLQVGNRQWVANETCGWAIEIGREGAARNATRAVRGAWASALTKAVFPGPMG